VTDFEWNPYGDEDEDEVLEEEYTGRPIPYSTTLVGDAHHQDCPDGPLREGDCICKVLFESKYQKEQEEELEAMHAEYWT
jgi:hypothetical protein